MQCRHVVIWPQYTAASDCIISKVILYHDTRIMCHKTRNRIHNIARLFGPDFRQDIWSGEAISTYHIDTLLFQDPLRHMASSKQSELKQIQWMWIATRLVSHTDDIFKSEHQFKTNDDVTSLATQPTTEFFLMFFISAFFTSLSLNIDRCIFQFGVSS